MSGAAPGKVSEPSWPVAGSAATIGPSTDRNVVCAICEVATMKFSTWTIAAFGSTIRKYATAFTLSGYATPLLVTRLLSAESSIGLNAR